MERKNKAFLCKLSNNCLFFYKVLKYQYLQKLTIPKLITEVTRILNDENQPKMKTGHVKKRQPYKYNNTKQHDAILERNKKIRMLFTTFTGNAKDRYNKIKNSMELSISYQHFMRITRKDDNNKNAYGHYERCK